MIFRQLFEPVSSTYTYVLGCEDTGQAVLIDPVISATDRDLAELARLDLQLAFTLIPTYMPTTSPPRWS